MKSFAQWWRLTTPTHLTCLSQACPQWHAHTHTHRVPAHECSWSPSSQHLCGCDGCCGGGHLHDMYRQVAIATLTSKFAALSTHVKLQNTWWGIAHMTFTGYSKGWVKCSLNALHCEPTSRTSNGWDKRGPSDPNGVRQVCLATFRCRLEFHSLEQR